MCDIDKGADGGGRSQSLIDHCIQLSCFSMRSLIMHYGLVLQQIWLARFEGLSTNDCSHASCSSTVLKNSTQVKLFYFTISISWYDKRHTTGLEEEVLKYTAAQHPTIPAIMALELEVPSN